MCSIAVVWQSYLGKKLFILPFLAAILEVRMAKVGTLCLFKAVKMTGRADTPFSLQMKTYGISSSNP